MSLARDLSRWRHQESAAPLTMRRAWHSAATSQLAVVQSVPGFRTIIVGGGNRSGKTRISMEVTVALTLGSDHPHARRYWLAHGVNPDLLPKGPAEAGVFARSSNASIKNHRRQFESLLPPGSFAWHNRDNKGEAYVEVTVPGYDRTARLFFLSCDQGEDVFSGAEWRVTFMDEEGPAKVWDEAGARVASLNGWQIMANTPLKGRTWVYWRYVATTPARCVYLEINPADNPHLPPETVAYLASLDKSESRLRGAWVEVEGAVYPEWSRVRHILTRPKWRQRYPEIPWPDDGWPVLPPEWPRFRAMDFGAANPCVVLWFAVDTHGRRVYYREAYHQGQAIASWWAPLILRAEGVGDGPTDWTGLPGDRAAERGWADPAGAQEIRDLRAAGVYFAKANKSLTAGISRVREGLQADGHIAVLDGACPKLVGEIEQYQWPEQRDEKANAKEVPRKKDDHAVDCFRYGEVGARRYLRLSSFVADEGEEAA